MLSTSAISETNAAHPKIFVRGQARDSWRRLRTVLQPQLGGNNSICWSRWSWSNCRLVVIGHRTRVILTTTQCSFIGTTRNSFQGMTVYSALFGSLPLYDIGKIVTNLEYQAYSKLAIKTMADIVRSVQVAVMPSSPEALRCAVHHRLGVVPVGEPSIGKE